MLIVIIISLLHLLHSQTTKRLAGLAEVAG